MRRPPDFDINVLSCVMSSLKSMNGALNVLSAARKAFGSVRLRMPVAVVTIFPACTIMLSTCNPTLASGSND